MTHADRTRLVARLLAGVVPLRLNGRPYRLLDPTPLQRLLAEESAAESAGSAREGGLYEDEDAVALAAADGTWDADKAGRLDRAEADVDDLKAALYEGWSRDDKREEARGRLARCRELIAELSSLKWSYKHMTVSAHAAARKARLLAGFGLTDPAGNRVYGDDPDAWADAALLDLAVAEAARLRPSEAELRELARTNPWQGYWSVGKPNPFGCAAAGLGDDRLALCGLSVMYDNVRDSPDRPPEEVIADDDALDGWMVVQRRKSGGDRDAIRRQVVGTGRAAGCQEVFALAGSPAEVERVDALNDFEARRVNRDRFRQVREQGAVRHQDLRDVKAGIELRVQEMEARRQRGG